MSWFDFLPPWMQMQAGTTAPIPPPQMGTPPGTAPFQYGPQDKFGVAGVQNAIFGQPYLEGAPPLPPNIEARGPGFEIQRPPQPRNPMPASSPPPMMGQGQPDIWQHSFQQPPAATTSAPPQPDGPGFFGRNKELIGDIGGALSAMGQGISQTPPGAGWMTGLNLGASNASRYAQGLGERKLDERLKKAQVGEIETKAEQRKATIAFADTIKDPTARSYMKLGLTEKALDRLEKIDPEERQRIIDFEVQKQNALMPGKIAIAQAGKPEINVAIPKAETAAGKLANDIERLEALAAKNPGNKTFQQALKTAKANLASEGLTQDMRKDAGYGERALAAHQAASSLEGSKKFDPTGTYAAAERAARGLPVVGPVIGGPLMRRETESYELMKREFAAAVLRRESGATIQPSEFEDVNKRYFAQPGDDPQTVKQKAELRKRTVDSIIRSAGGAYNGPEDAPPPPPGFNRIGR